MDINQKQEMSPDPEVDLVDEAEQAAKTAERLQAFGSGMAKRRDEWVTARAAAGVDRRMAEDLDNYHSRDKATRMASDMMTSVEAGFPTTQQRKLPQRSTIFVGITRQKTNAAEARLADIVLPTDERNWSIAPTPDPQIAHLPGVQTAVASASMQAMAMAGTSGPAGVPGMTDAAAQATSPTGQGVVGQQQPIAGAGAVQPSQPGAAPAAPAQPLISPEEQALLDRQRDAKRKSDSMRQEIDDALVQCDYQGELRKVIHDAAMLGTGVLKGPVVVSRTRKAWKRLIGADGAETYVMEKISELSPASYRIDPRYFFPDPACGENVQNGRGAFEYDTKTSRQVRALAKQPGYLVDQIREVIDQGPKQSKGMTIVREHEGKDLASDQLFEHWTYTGEIDREDLEAAGVEISDDTLEVVSACIEMINDTVVRAYLNPLEDGALPYDTFPWEKVVGSVWGEGVPYLMRAQQSAVNSGWRQMMDNAGMTAGPQVVIKPNSVKPADGNWQITPRKAWLAMDDVADVRTAFTSVEFNSHQGDLANIIKMAGELVDQETSIPEIVQGNQGSAPETVGGMQMLVNGANVVLRRLVKQFDDFITKKHIQRYYDYFMAYSDKNEIKGDFFIQALGSSSLIVRDLQNQGVTNMLSLGTNPVYAPMLRVQKLFEKALRAQHIDPQEVMLTPDEIAANAQKMAENQQPDPRVQAAQVRAEADVQRTQAQSAADAAEIQFRAEMLRIDHEARIAELQLQREIKMLELSTKSNIALDQIKAQLAATGIKERARQDMQTAELQLKAQTGSGI